MGSSQSVCALSVADKALADTLAENAVERARHELSNDHLLTESFGGNFRTDSIREDFKKLDIQHHIGGYNLALRYACEDVRKARLDEPKKIEALVKVRVLVQLADSHEIIANMVEYRSDDFIELFTILLESGALQASLCMNGYMSYMGNIVLGGKNKMKQNPMRAPTKVGALLENTSSSLTTNKKMYAAMKTLWENNNKIWELAAEVYKCQYGHTSIHIGSNILKFSEFKKMLGRK